MPNRASIAAITGIAAHAGHEAGDYLVQTDTCARRKQDRDNAGRRALATHIATYAATQHLTKAALYKIAGLRVHPLAQLAGTVTEATWHSIIDDGRLLAVFARATRKWRFHELGVPRPVAAVVDHDDEVRQVRLVPTDADGKPVIELDETGRINNSTGPHDNPSPATGRALLDQAAHKGLQIPLGIAATVLTHQWLTRY